MTLILLLLSYLIGSIPFALLVGVGFYKTDVRKHGSGNLGTTNSFRVLGKKAGVMVLIGDVSKGAFAASLPFLMNVEVDSLLIGIPAIIGHCYPVFASFKGGKAVATTSGVLLYTFPLAFLVSLLFFLITLKVSKYVSLSSIIATYSVFIYSLFLHNFTFIVFSFLISLFISYKHRTNIERILDKSEPKINSF